MNASGGGCGRCLPRALWTEIVGRTGFRIRATINEQAAPRPPCVMHAVRSGGLRSFVVLWVFPIYKQVVPIGTSSMNL